MIANIELIGIYNNTLYLLNVGERILEGIIITEDIKRNLYNLTCMNTIEIFNSFEELENKAFNLE